MPNGTTNFAIRRYQCRHIFTDGHRCGSPCLRDEDFCYYHHTTRRPKQAIPHDPYNEPPNQTSFTLSIPEDRSAIQHAIGQIMTQLANNALDPRRAGLLLYALQIASMNLKNAPRHKTDDMVQEVTLDPTQGPLAPKAEVPGDQEYRQLLHALEQADGDDLEDEDEEEDPDEDDETEETPSLDLFATAASP